MYRRWIGSRDDKNDRRGRGQGSPNQQLPRTAHLFEKLLRFDQMLTAVRTDGHMIFHALALRAREAAIEIARNLSVCYVIAPLVRCRAHNTVFPGSVGGMAPALRAG